ncbi:2-iminobutanoate/2-iminopropanoate deaminase [Nitrobacteraceae bacterium AZCC 2161]
MPNTNSPIRAISSAAASVPGGHYSQAVVHGGLVYISGQLPVVSGQAHDSDAPFETQVRRAIDNLATVLIASGSSIERILKLSAYVVGVENWAAFNSVYAQMLGAARPARSVIPVPDLHYGYLVEIDAIAAQGEGND